MLVGALTRRSGLSRMVLTSRRRPAQLDALVRVEPVHALSLDVRCCSPGSCRILGALITGICLLGGGGPGRAAPPGRGLAVRVLAAAQGHPKLLELADGQATDPARLEKLLG